jgi:outer membrane protein TolC
VAAAASVRAEGPVVQGTMPEDLMPALGPLLKEAVERSPSTITASIALAQAEAAHYQESSALWPHVSGTVDYQVSQESVSVGSPSRSSGLFYSVGVNQAIFQWNAYRNQAKIGELGEKVAQRQFAEAYRNLASLVRQQYMALIGKKLYLRNTRFTQKTSEEALAAEQARFEAGSASEADVQGFKLALEEAKLAADRAQEDYDYGKRLFTRLVGIDMIRDDDIAALIPHPEYSAALADTVLSGFVGNGIESTFQNEVYKMMVKQQDLNYSIAKVILLPKFGANANISYSTATQAATNSITQVKYLAETASIAASWDIFDGFSARGAKLSALANRRQYERIRQTYVDTTIDTISDMRHQLGFSSRAMALAEIHNALIEAEVKRLGDDRNLGYGSQATIDAGIVNQNATQYYMAQARADYLSRWTDFVSLAGIDPAIENLPERYVR